MDEPVPVRRAVIGCLALVVVGVVAVLLVRPAIFSLAPPRDDSAVIVATLSELSDGPIRRDVVLSRSYGHDGEIDAGSGRVQLALVVAPAAFGSTLVLNGASPGPDGCAVEVEVGRLVDCTGRAWTLDGRPIDASDEPLQQFAVEVVEGAVRVDLTEAIGD
jgi:hypothetical protein